MRRTWQIAGSVAVAMFVGQTILWHFYAKHSLLGYAWAGLVLASIDDVSEDDRADCVSVDPQLFSAVPPRLQEEVKQRLSSYDVRLQVKPPTRNPPTGYLHRECVEHFIPPESQKGRYSPFLARPNIAYYTYDYNGDAVTMLQVGPTWVYLRHKTVWF